MDINSLLSPSDSPAGTPTPQPPPALPSPSMLQSPRKRTERPGRQIPSRTHSGLSQQITSSPQPHSVLQQVPSPGFAHISNGARAMHSAMTTPQPLGSPRDTRMTPPQPMFRQASTPGMDTLAGRYPLLLRVSGGQEIACWRYCRTVRPHYAGAVTREDAVGSELQELATNRWQISPVCSNNRLLDRRPWPINGR
jgi:hypothetical protein